MMIDLRFKSHEVEEEWFSNNLDKRVRWIVLIVAGYCCYHWRHVITITSIFRNYDRAQPHSPHPFWRAVDVRVHDMPEGCAEGVEAFINGSFVYDRLRPHLKVALLHTVSGKPEDLHLHFQVVEEGKRGSHELLSV